MSHAAAYRKVSGNDHSSDCKADQWMNARGVEERIMELRRENDRKCTLSREAALQFLTEVVNTPIGAVTKDSRLAQAMKDTDDVHEIRMPDKLVAVQTLGKMCAWFSAERIELSASSLTEYLSALRSERAELIGDCVQPAKVIELESVTDDEANGEASHRQGADGEK